MTTPRVVMINFWRNDANRNLEARVKHLLSKTYPNLRWLWSVGDSDDDTKVRIWNYAVGMGKEKQVQLVDSTTNIEGTEMPERLRRLSKMASMTFAHIREDDDFVILHESDLQSPPDVIERLMRHGKMPIAAWPLIPVSNGLHQFYDTWAFHRYGSLFTAFKPHNPAWLDRDSDVFEVDGFGSVWMAKAEDIRGMVVEKEAIREICRALKQRGLALWTDCSLYVVQPRELLECHVVTPL